MSAVFADRRCLRTAFGGHHCSFRKWIWKDQWIGKHRGWEAWRDGVQDLVNKRAAVYAAIPLKTGKVLFA